MYLPPFTNPEQITKDPTLRAIKPWWVIFIGTTILYFIPAQELLEFSAFGTAVNWLASLIPSIARWVELSPFPHNTKLFAVFVWMMIPVQIYWLITSIEVKCTYQAVYTAKSTKQKPVVRVVAFLAGSVFFGGIILLAFNFALIDTPPCRVCVNTSRWAQLFIGCLTSMTISMIVVGLVLNAPLLFKSFTSQGKNHA